MFIGFRLHQLKYIYFCGLEVNLSNRVLRNYPENIDNFLRVSFVDEDLGKMRSADLCPRTGCAEEKKTTRVHENGMVTGDKKFEFLAFSKSQLREQSEHSAWIFASFQKGPYCMHKKLEIGWKSLVT